MASEYLTLLDDDEREYLSSYLVGDPKPSGEWKSYCPLCEEPGTSSSPSAGFNFTKGYWHCFSCEGDADLGGKINALIRHLKSGKHDSNVVDIKTKQKIPQARKKKIPELRTVEAWHQSLLAQSALLKRFREKRGLSLAIIKAAKIGFDQNTRRFTIPIFDASGQLISVKGYRMSQRAVQNKMIFIPEGTTSLYNEAILGETDVVCIVEGELDSLTLVDRDVPAVGHTGGAGGWQPGWAAAFKGKVVYVIPDEDTPGQKGADKIIDSLEGIAEQTYRVNLGLNKPKADVTDFLVKYGFTVRDLKKRFAEARETPLQPIKEKAPSRGKKVSLQESQAPTDEVYQLDLQVVGKITPPYLAPRRFIAKCDMNKGKTCLICPMKRRGGEAEAYIEPNDPTILLNVEANESKAHAAMVKQVGAKCSDRIDFTIKEKWSVEQLYVSESTEDIDVSETFTPLTREMFSVGTYSTDTNIFAEALAVNVEDPRNSRGVLQSWKLEPRQSRIDDFHMTSELREALKIFQVGRHQTPFEKAVEIAHDLSHNVTKIYGRDMMHVTMDLVWHSVMGFDLAKQYIHKGWLEALIIGDTRTGKSEIARALAAHYNAGTVRTCEGATLAGLVGGAQQMSGKNWSITWGLIPLNDRRLVVLDEMSGLKDKGIIEQMSSIRSDGRASLTKIASHETSARARLLWISNPTDGKTITEVPGMEAMRRLVTSPEDIARFDFAMAASNNEVSAKVINTTKRAAVDHVYIRKLCRDLVLWAWSRRPENIRWADGAEDLIMQESQKLGALYSNDPPLVQAANIRVKLARIAVAFAARTFSTDASGELVLVRKMHVTSAVRFLNTIYGTDAMGYLRHSRRIHDERTKAINNVQVTKRYLKQSPDLAEVLFAIGDDHFRIQDFEGLETVDGYTALRTLRAWHMIRRVKRGFYAKEPALIGLLRDLEDE